MAQTLPDLFDFGTSSLDGQFALEIFDPEVEPENVDLFEVEEELGVDIAFDFERGEITTTTGGGLRVKNIGASLAQWCVFALLTPRGQDILYSEQFGSECDSVLGRNVPRDLILPELSQKIQSALLTHDRIESVQDFVYTELADGTINVSCTVLTDDDRSFVFEALNVG